MTLSTHTLTYLTPSLSAHCASSLTGDCLVTVHYSKLGEEKEEEEEEEEEEEDRQFTKGCSMATIG